MAFRREVNDFDKYIKRKGASQKLYPALRLLKGIESETTKNHLRGVVAQHREREIYSRDLNRIRLHASDKDLLKSSELLLGSEGIFPHPNTSNLYKALITKHALNELKSNSELYFIVGHLNGWKDRVCNIIAAMQEFASLVTASPTDGANALSLFADHYGASNYLVRKVAYVSSIFGETADLQPHLQAIAAKLEQNKCAAPYFMSLELLDKDFPYFSGISTRVQVYNKHIEGDFRNVFALNEVVPTPICQKDIGPFLRKAYNNSLVDEVQSIIVILNLEENWPKSASILRSNLCDEIKEAISQLQATRFATDELYKRENPLNADFVFYRRAQAFVEFSDCTKYRFAVDRIVAPRLIPDTPQINETGYFGNATSAKDLTKATFGYRNANDYLKTQNCGNFLRTIQFIAYLACKKYPTINHQFVRAIFERTVSLDVLLREDELEQLYERSDEQSRPLISVLALALHKAKRHDDDVDFSFRFSLSNVVHKSYSGDLTKFVEWLLPNTPEIANYLVSILDRSTLQKLYWLIKTADEADVVRQALLRLLGKQRNEIRYYVEADSIEASRQVAKLKRYFDDSRIYVDGIAFKTWMTANPNSYSQQYIKIIERNYDLLTARTIRLENGNLKVGDAFDVSTLASYDYVLLEAARIAFQHFCTSRDFGIESYLGRRIRHNTLSGMLRSGVENLIDAPGYFPLRVDRSFWAANAEWITSYRSLVEEMRKDILQFQSDQRPKGIFTSALADDDNTRANIVYLRNLMSQARTPELFNEFLIRFCWQEIDPQLRRITRVISSDLLKRANEIVENSIGSFDGDLHRQYRSQIREAIHERFTRLASWFRQPEDGFVPASTRQLADLILLESGINPHEDEKMVVFVGSALELVMDGLSVHRMYDCLFVLLTNALKYGDLSKPIIIDAEVDISQLESLRVIKINVTSQNQSGPEGEANYYRLKQSFQSSDIGAAMVKEGYSGLKKLRFITKNSEGFDTANYAISDRSCTISFSLTVEIAKKVANEDDDARLGD
ncbi:hypothetical protein E8E01_18415 [Methylorubrum populi]|uniref:hypothetical protein n=1 Tax=Methylorubrum populi TaxID=223967 RepID=UPI0011548BC6|nr:hypothetical protein [Methylorubrum populi]QDI82260.1 hypothetical protein E8E01_18415 [Methylorubrum populi]